MTARQFAMATARQHVATSGFAYHLARGCDGARCGVLAVELADRVVKAMTDSDERTRPLGDVVAGAVREFVTANMRRPKDERELRRGELLRVVRFALQAAAAETERVAAKVEEEEEEEGGGGGTDHPLMYDRATNGRALGDPGNTREKARWLLAGGPSSCTGVFSFPGPATPSRGAVDQALKLTTYQAARRAGRRRRRTCRRRTG